MASEPGRPSARHDDGLPGDVGGVLGAQERRQAGDIVGLAEPGQGGEQSKGLERDADASKEGRGQGSEFSVTC